MLINLDAIKFFIACWKKIFKNFKYCTENIVILPFCSAVRGLTKFYYCAVGERNVMTMNMKPPLLKTFGIFISFFGLLSAILKCKNLQNQCLVSQNFLETNFQVLHCSSGRNKTRMPQNENEL